MAHWLDHHYLMGVNHEQYEELGERRSISEEMRFMRTAEYNFLNHKIN
jgi:hypothetical protein